MKKVNKGTQMGKYRISILLIITLLFLKSNFAFAETLRKESFSGKSGPVSIRNQMPLHLLYLQMVPDRAEVIKRDRLTINANYTVSNVTVSAFTPATSLYDIQIDMEVSRVTLDFRYGLYDNLEIGLEVPYMSFSSGYLDNFIEGVEDGIGARTPRSRERQGSYEFEYSFRYNNQYLIREKRSTEGLGDIVLNAKYQLLKEDRGYLPNISIRSAIKFPTAKKKNLLGSGEVDYGFGLLLDKGFFDNRLFLYTGASVVLIEKPSFFSELGLDKEVYSGMLAIEYFFTKRFSFVSQVSGNTTPYPFSDTNALDNDAHELALGFNYKWKERDDVLCHFAIIENITSASSPDVSFHMGLNWKF